MKLFRGTYTALITPFTSDNRIDWASLERMVEMQIAGGVEGIVFVGTSGESPTLTYEEHFDILKRSVKMVNGRCKVVHGTGSNSTAETIESAQVAVDAGADAQLLVNPYYNKPSQEGLYQHFKAVADATNLPIILYNIKGRTAVNLETPTLVRLAQHKNIVGMKEASGDLTQMMDVIRKMPADFSVLVGDDGLSLPFMAAGGDGLISVVSNALPKTTSDFIRLCLAGKYEEARKIFYSLFDVMQIAFVETNPVPIKEMMSILGYCQPNFRLPLWRASESSMTEIRKAVEIIKSLE